MVKKIEHIEQIEDRKILDQELRSIQYLSYHENF